VAANKHHDTLNTKDMRRKIKVIEYKSHALISNVRGRKLMDYDEWIVIFIKYLNKRGVSGVWHGIVPSKYVDVFRCPVEMANKMFDTL
jgi:hypothetical protein